MKIGFLVQTLGSGGAERAASALANSMAQKGFDAKLIVFNDESLFYSLNEKVDFVNLELKEIPQGLSFGRVFGCIKRVFEVRKKIKNLDLDVLVCMSNIMTAYGTFSTLFTKTKTVGTERSNPYKLMNSRFLRLLRKASALLSNGFVFQTFEASKFFPKNVQKKGAIIPNAVFNPLVYQIEPPKARQNIIYAMGRLSKEKRFDLVIDAFKIICEKEPDCKLVIFGEGELKETLQKQINDLDLEKRAVLAGANLNALEFISKGRAFVLSSDFEGMPNALLEAMAVGVPCVSTRCKMGPEELIVNEENGILVETGSAKEIAQAVLKIMNDETFAAKLAQNGKKLLDTHNINAITERWLEYLKQL